jgi:hypothetical protein
MAELLEKAPAKFQAELLEKARRGLMASFILYIRPALRPK